MKLLFCPSRSRLASADWRNRAASGRRHHEPTSYHQILKLLGRHVHERESPHRDRAAAELKDLREWEKDALRPTIELRWQHAQPDGTIAYEEELTPPVLIDLFLHGRYLHKGNEKSDRLHACGLDPGFALTLA